MENASNAVALAMVLLGSLLVNALLIGLMLLRGAGRGSFLLIWTGNGWIPVKVKPGQTRYVWKRPDKTKVAIPLLPEFQQRYGVKGSCWMANGANGQLLAYRAEQKKWVSLEPATQEKPRLWRLWQAGDDSDAVEGALMRPEWSLEPFWPDGNKYAEVLDDERERKWFSAQLEADKSKSSIKPIWILIGLGAVIWFMSQNGGLHF